MSQTHMLAWLSLAVVMAQVDDNTYCGLRYERLCQGKGLHVGCQFPYRGRGEACKNSTAIIFSENLKRFILHYINRRRQRIASGNERVRGGVHLPKPEIMMLVQWDRELAILAKRLADQCRFVHDDCRATVRYPYAGQTVGEVRWRRSGESIEFGARRSIGRVFDAWWGEKRRVQAKQLTSPFMLTARGAVWGHFSQLAVWTLRAMGCGAVHHGTTRPRLLLVCDFSHTNMLGQMTISPGPLAKCPLHTMRVKPSHYPLLCGPVHQSQPPEPEEKFYDQHRAEDYEEDEDEVQTPRSRPNRPYRPEPDDVMEEEVQTIRIVETSRAFEEQTEVSVRYRGYEGEVRGVLQEKLAEELDMRNKAVVKTDTERDWIMRRKAEYKARLSQGQWPINKRPYLNEPRRDYHVIDGEEVREMSRDLIPIRETSSTELQEVTTAMIYRPTAVFTSELSNRQRWKKPRNRPLRPGADALLHTPPSKFIKRRSKASLQIDKDDADQLFRDTGFKIP